MSERKGSISRRQMMGLLGAAGIATPLLLEACTTGNSTATSGSGISGTGNNKLIIWVPASINVYNLGIDVGFHEACAVLGWQYQKIGTPEAQASPQKSVDNIHLAIQRKPAVLAVTMLGAPTTAAIKEAMQAGIYTIVVNSRVTPDWDTLGIGFVGPSFVGPGVVCGTNLCQEIMKKGKKSGKIVCGNLFPGGAAIEGRYQGIAQGVQTFNSANGTSFTTENFPDNALDAVKGVSTYKAKILQEGSKLAAFGPLGLPSTELMPQVLKEAGLQPGQLPAGGFDVSDKISQGIRDGWITFAIDQQFYSQGWVSTVLAWQAVERTQAPTPDYDTGQLVINKNNVDSITARDAKIQQLAKNYGIKD
jgi:ABC-type sugar transport system substrate-binding protein